MWFSTLQKPTLYLFTHPNTETISGLGTDSRNGATIVGSYTFQTRFSDFNLTGAGGSIYLVRTRPLSIAREGLYDQLVSSSASGSLHAWPVPARGGSMLMVLSSKAELAQLINLKGAGGYCCFKGGGY